MPARPPGRRRAGLARRLGVVPPALKSGADAAQERALDRTARAIADAAANEAAARAASRPAPEGLVIPEAAAALGVSVRTLRRRQAAGELAIDARTPWGTQAITEAELSRHRAARRPERGGRPRVLPEEVAARAHELRESGLSYARASAPPSRPPASPPPMAGAAGGPRASGRSLRALRPAPPRPGRASSCGSSPPTGASEPPRPRAPRIRRAERRSEALGARPPGRTPPPGAGRTQTASPMMQMHPPSERVVLRQRFEGMGGAGLLLARWRSEHVEAVQAATVSSAGMVRVMGTRCSSAGWR
jgi:hypothetical protein